MSNCAEPECPLSQSLSPFVLAINKRGLPANRQVISRWEPGSHREAIRPRAWHGDVSRDRCGGRGGQYKSGWHWRGKLRTSLCLLPPTTTRHICNPDRTCSLSTLALGGQPSKMTFPPTSAPSHSWTRQLALLPPPPFYRGCRRQTLPLHARRLRQSKESRPLAAATTHSQTQTQPRRRTAQTSRGTTSTSAS